MSWTPPPQQVDRYEIQAIAVDQGSSRRRRATPQAKSIVSGNKNSGIINDLQPYTSYAFDVISIVDFNGKTTPGSSALPTDPSQRKVQRTKSARKFYYAVVP